MEKYLEILKREKIRNISIINFIENNLIDNIEDVGTSLIVRGKSDRNWVYIACYDPCDINRVKEHLTQEDTCFGAIENWMVPTISRSHEVLWNLSLKQYFLPSEVQLPKLSHEVKDLTEKDAETIYSNSDYKGFMTVDYVVDRIKNGPGKGVFENDKLVAWGLTHDDGALGFLHVLETDRKKGFATSVTVALIKEVRSQGKIPFAYIEPDNQESINLCMKLGFHWQKDCQWFELKK